MRLGEHVEDRPEQRPDRAADGADVGTAPDGPRHGMAQRRGARLPIALAATIASWLLLSAALGLGSPRASGSASAVLWTALAAAGGLALGIVACVLVLRAARSWWMRLLLVPWLLALLVGVYSLSIALAAVYPAHLASSLETPPGAARVDMTTADGVRLSGWYLESRNGAAVVLRHGAGGDASQAVEHARELHAAGYGVLATDARGHGASAGQGMDLGWFGELDTRAAIDALTERAEVDPRRIGVVGLSMGGEEAIGAAGVDERISAVVAEGATGRTAADKAWLADAFGAAGVVQGMLDAVTYGLVDLLTPGVPPPTLQESVRAAAPTPVLLVAAGGVADERSVAELLVAVDPSRVQLWVVQDAGHVEALGTDPEGWRDRVVGFLDAALAAD